jgi:hypothetical protein
MLLIADRCGIDMESIERMTDEEFGEMLARARWLEEREIMRIEQGLIRALARAFGKKR